MVPEPGHFQDRNGRSGRHEAQNTAAAGRPQRNSPQVPLGEFGKDLVSKLGLCRAVEFVEDEAHSGPAISGKRGVFASTKPAARGANARYYSAKPHREG